MINKYQKAWQKICDYAYGNENLSHEQFEDLNNHSGKLIQELVDNTVCDLTQDSHSDWIKNLDCHFDFNEDNCQNALMDLKNNMEMILGEESDLLHCIEILNQLITKYFQNPALSYEEFSVGEPIFDDYTKCWLLVTKKNQIHDAGHYPTFQAFNGEELSMEEMEFEENRYYRKKVLE